MKRTILVVLAGLAFAACGSDQVTITPQKCDRAELKTQTTKSLKAYGVDTDAYQVVLTDVTSYSDGEIIVRAKVGADERGTVQLQCDSGVYRPVSVNLAH